VVCLCIPLIQNGPWPFVFSPTAAIYWPGATASRVGLTLSPHEQYFLRSASKMPSLSSEQRAAIAIGVPVVALLLYLWYRRRQNSQFSDEDEDFTQAEESEEVASANQRTVEVRVPGVVVGALIGKSGVNIKKIEKDTGVRVNLKDENEGSESEERILLIQGEREKAKRAEILVKKIIAEQPVIRTEEIFIPQRACGRVIGKGGQTIRHMCSVSGGLVCSMFRKCTKRVHDTFLKILVKKKHRSMKSRLTCQENLSGN